MARVGIARNAPFLFAFDLKTIAAVRLSNLCHTCCHTYYVCARCLGRDSTTKFEREKDPATENYHAKVRMNRCDTSKRVM